VKLARAGIFFGGAFAGVALGCAPPAPGAPAADSTVTVAAELDALSRGVTRGHEATFLSILDDTLSADAYHCLPSPRRVFSADAPDGERRIAGVMPHYGFFFGPMSYLLRHRAGRWEVDVRIAVELPTEGDVMELPDCAIPRELEGDRGDIAEVGATCAGTPYSASPSLSACPGSGTFSIVGTRGAQLALLRRWSREAASYWNRDAAAFGLPVRYRFTFEPSAAVPPGFADLRVPLALTCGRTPYFSAFRSGWSLPIVAHEVGHVLGLLDEYETFSGLSPCYPKTPFPGAEVSRMGLSMREGTLVLPLHHYLVLRRYFCEEPPAGPYEGGL